MYSLATLKIWGGVNISNVSAFHSTSSELRSLLICIDYSVRARLFQNLRNLESILRLIEYRS